MIFKQWLRKVFGPRVQVSRPSRRGRRNWLKPRLEILEDRIAPTVSLSYSSVSGTLTVEAANSTSAPAAIFAHPTPNGVEIDTVGDTMSFPSGTPSGFTLTTVGSGSTGDSILSTTNTISSLTISGPNGTSDTADTVTLGSLSLTGGLSVSAGTINFASATNVVTANSASLTSVNSLTFAQTGVPYLGSVKINDGPPPGQPFAIRLPSRTRRTATALCPVARTPSPPSSGTTCISIPAPMQLSLRKTAPPRQGPTPMSPCRPLASLLSSRPPR
jgi:hypothetical protein